ncbi:inositol monophosphatase [Patescibacteria group bacterium]|nr:inositol monophosphatase [Patescibacteria group bacterium]
MHEREIAAKVARLAGEELMARLQEGGEKQIQQKDFGEQVTNFDREINQFIIEELQAHFPEHDIVTEEADVIDAKSEHDRWFVDPIDGTNNFVRHIPLYGVSIGYERKGVMSAGAIYDPLNKILFSGSLEDGAFVGKEPTKVSDIDQLSNSMVFEGYGYAPEYKARHVNIVAELNKRTKFRRNLGTAALMLAYVARGDVDGLILTGIKAWDCAAGAVLIRAAGGKVTNYQDEDWSAADEMIIASNGKIHEELLEIVHI